MNITLKKKKTCKLATKLIILTFTVVFLFFCQYVQADSIRESSTFSIGALLKNMIPDARDDPGKSIPTKVIVVMDRDHLAPLSEDIVNELQNRVEQLGGHIGSHAFNNVQVWIPLGKIEELAAWQEIRLIKLPTRPQLHSIVSKGVSVIEANSWQNAGWYGQGVKIGIIDSGFQSYSSRLGTELPDSVKIKVFGGDINSSYHGTQCAEIIHDVAPGAELYFAVIDDLDSDFYNAADWLKSQGVRIISCSMGLNSYYYISINLYQAIQSPYLESIYIQMLENLITLEAQMDYTIDLITQEGAIWCIAAGNLAKKQWSGLFIDTDGDNILNFSGYDELNMIGLPLNIPYEEEIYITLFWDENNIGHVYDDYDLFIIDGPGNIVDSSVIPQQVNGIPIEACKFLPVPGVNYYVAVLKYSGGPMQLKFFLGEKKALGNLEYYSPDASIWCPAENADAITVGAVPVNNPGQIEDFSSRGPATNDMFKPDLVAPDGVSTSFGPAYGTSFSTPHVAGAAALVLQAHPDWGPAQIKAALEMSALDIGTPGQDYDSGVGLLKMGMLLETLGQCADLTGFWWNPARDGSGISIERHGNTDFLSWYTYFCNATGDSTWLTAGGYPYSSMIGPFELDSWSGWPLGETPGYFESRTTGNIALLFRGSENATLRVTDPETNEVLTTWDLERFYFGPSTGDSRNGWWWDPAQAGNGVFIEFQGDQLFAAWYSYRSDNSGRWWTLHKYGFNGNSPELLPVTEWTGGACFYSQQVLPIPNQVGEATLTFQDAGHATLSWRADGQSGTYQLQRFLLEN